MQINHNASHGEIIVGADISEEEFTNPTQVTSEIRALEAVIGINVQDGIEPLVAAAQAECPEANCCLRALCKSSSQHVVEQVDDRDDSYDFPTMSIDVRCDRGKGCGERVKSLTGRLGDLARASIEAHEEADGVAAAIIEPAREEARQIVATAEEKAEEMRIDASRNAQNRRSNIYHDVRVRFMHQEPVEA